VYREFLNQNSGKRTWRSWETKQKDDFESYWQDEKDWLCIVEFLPTDNSEARLFAADIIGYLVGYANLTNTVPWHSSAILTPALASFYFPSTGYPRARPIWRCSSAGKM
jgi:hypothetical protein